MAVPPDFWHTPTDEERIYVDVPSPATDAEIRRWEEAHGVRLPPTLAEALTIQDGGTVRGTDLSFEPLDVIASLDGEEWDHVEEGRGLPPGDRHKQFLVGDYGGLGVVLDYTDGPEPKVLTLWHDLSGELRDGGYGTFDLFLQSVQLKRGHSDQDEQGAE